MPEEIWKDIPGFEGMYQASTFGRIRSKDHYVRIVAKGTESKRISRGQILKPGKQMATGHTSVVLGRKHGSMQVHAAVALTFLGPRPAGKEVCHNDGNPENNRLDNLRYDTRTNNILDVYRIGGRWRKLNLADIQAIANELKAGRRGSEVARKFGVSQATVSKIKRGAYKSCQLLQNTPYQLT